MCSSLSDLFACIRYQGDAEADSTSSTHHRNTADLDDEAPDLQPKPEQIRQRSATFLAQHHDSLTVPPGPAGPPSTDYLRPSLRPARVSYEALERYDRIYGRSLPDAWSSGAVRNIPDQF